MRFRSLLLHAALVGVLVLSTGCSGADETSVADGAVAPGTEASAGPSDAPTDPTGAAPEVEPGTAAPEVELEVPYPAPADTARIVPDGLETVTSEEGHQFTLVGVHRLAEDRVVVTGLLGLNPDVGQDFVIDGFEEPALRRSNPGGSEFAPFELTVNGDDTTYLPVRDSEGSCHCSVVRSGFQEQSEAMAVMTVMTAPADAEAVDLTMEGFGEITAAAITPVPEQVTTPWGATETLTVRSAERQGGTVTARITAASPQDQTGWGYGVYGVTSEQLCLAGVTVVGTGQQTGLVEGCVRGTMPPSGMAEDLQITLPDPGTGSLVVLPANGWPMSVPLTGEAAEGSGEQLVTYEARTRTEGATVATGHDVEVVLDTAVLFAFDESTLTPDARRTLSVAVEALQGQDGRSLSIAGHTDTQGEADDNTQLSLARAEAVRDALAQELGDGWTFEVSGYGEAQPLAEEKGSQAEIERAQALNRRVEIVVGE